VVLWLEPERIDFGAGKIVRDSCLGVPTNDRDHFDQFGVAQTFIVERGKLRI